MSGQTVQILIRLSFTVCYSFCFFCRHFSAVRPICYNFRVITAKLWESKIKDFYSMYKHTMYMILKLNFDVTYTQETALQMLQILQEIQTDLCLY